MFPHLIDACALTEKTGLYVLTDDTDDRELTSDELLVADANTKFTIGCMVSSYFCCCCFECFSRYLVYKFYVFHLWLKFIL